MGPMREHSRLVVAALRGRKRLVAAPLAIVLAGVVLLLALLPPTYHVEGRLLARPDPVVSALVNPANTVPRDEPARFAAEMVRKRTNLERIVGEAGLMETWAASRGPLMRMVDRAREAWRGRASAEDRMDALVDLLEKRLYVRGEDGAVVIAVDWPDANAAGAIVDAAQRSFLEERRVVEVSSAEDTIAILDRHLARADETMTAATPASLRFAAAEHDRLSRRVWDARLELDGVRAAFDRRYAVLDPARTPRKAARPNVAAVLVAAALAGLLLGALTATAAEIRAAHVRQGGSVSRGAFGAFLAGLTLLTIGAVVIGNGKIAVGVAPVLAAGVIYGMWKAPARTSALVLLFLILALENPGDAGGRWRSPLYPLGALLLANLNLSLPVRALRFTGLDLGMGLLIVVILTRRAVRASVDRSEVRAAGPMSWAAALWLGTVLALWASGLARGGDFRNSLWQCHQLLWVPLGYFVFQSALRGMQDYGALARVVVAAACVKACLALWVRLTVSASADVLPTATSHGDSVLFACAFALVIALVIEEAWPGPVVAAGLVLALLAAGMVANNRRLVWVELAAAVLAVYATASATRRKRAVRRAALTALPVLALYTAVGWGSSARAFAPVRIVHSLVASRSDWSTAMRDIENFNLLWTLRDHPFVGTGFGHEYVEKVKAVDISSIFPQYRFVPHNSVLGLLAFGGVIGLSGIFLALVVGVFLAARTHRFARSPADRAAALAVIATVAVYLVQAYGDMGLVSWTGAFTLAAALAVAARLAPATGAWPGPVTAGR
jgi:hypothetical protein